MTIGLGMNYQQKLDLINRSDPFFHVTMLKEFLVAFAILAFLLPGNSSNTFGIALSSI